MWSGGFMLPGAMGVGDMGGHRGMMRRGFEEQYHCYSVAYADKAHLEKGDKILLPPSAFDVLARLQVDYPMLFKLTASPSSSTYEGDSTSTTRTTHCGVLEFTAEEGCVYIPFWMMQNLLIEEGSLLTVTNVSLPKATFVKLQPQSVDFLEISDPRAVLEHALRNFSCVTKGDIIQIPYNGKNYHFALQQVQPHPAACIIETDCNVDFDAPVGYQEPSYSKPNNDNSTAAQSAGNTAASTPLGGQVLGSKDDDEEEEDDANQPRTKIVNGEIVRPDGSAAAAPSAMVAERVGQTGIQRNAAIPVEAPTVDYWAVQAGDGARLDGKTPAALKTSKGETVDIRALRAEAAARRMQQQQLTAPGLSGTGKTLNGKPATTEAPAPVQPAVVSKRKPRVGAKYSRLKQSGSAFQGSAHHFK